MTNYEIRLNDTLTTPLTEDQKDWIGYLIASLFFGDRNPVASVRIEKGKDWRNKKTINIECSYETDDSGHVIIPRRGK